MTIPGHQLVLKFGADPSGFITKWGIYTHILHSNSKREKSFYPPIIWCCFCSSTFWHAWGFLIDLRVFIWFFQGKLPMEWSKENPPRLRWVMWKCIFQKSPGCRSRSKVGGPGLATTGTADFMWIFRDFFGTICYKLFNDFYGHMKQKLGNMSDKFRAIWLEHGTVSLTFWIWTLVPQMFFQSVETRIWVLGVTLCFACIFCVYQSAERSCSQVRTIFDLWNVSKDRYLSFTWSCLQVSSNILNGAACTILGMVKLLKRNSSEAQNYGWIKPIIPWVWGMNIHNFRVNRRAPAGFCWW